MRSRPQRLLFTASPAYGHLLPMFPLIRAAEMAGHEVRVATGPNLVPFALDRRLTAVAVGPSWQAITKARNQAVEEAGLEPDDPDQAIVAVGSLFGAPAAARLRDLRSLADGWRPDVVVHEPLDFSGPLLARELGVPSVLHGYGPMFESYSVYGPVVAEAAGDPEVWPYLLDAPVLDVCPPALRPPGPAIWPHAIDLRPSAGEAMPRESLDLERRHDALAYVTLGTVVSTPEALRTVVSAVSGLGLDVVATTGPGVDPATLGRLPAGVSVHQFLPQSLVLDQADVMVSQAGAGTMLGALVKGVPQVAVPLGADQPLNAEALARSGAGVVVEGGGLDVEAIAAAVTRVLDDPAPGLAAKRVQAQIQRMPSARTVLPELLDDLTGGELARLGGAAS